VGSNSTCRSACRDAKYTEELTAFGGLDAVAAVTGEASDSSDMHCRGKREERRPGERKRSVVLTSIEAGWPVHWDVLAPPKSREQFPRDRTVADGRLDEPSDGGRGVFRGNQGSPLLRRTVRTVRTVVSYF
jgi:hypothetical protein